MSVVIEKEKGLELFREFEITTFYKNAYKKELTKELPQAWYEVMWANGEYNVEDLKGFEKGLGGVDICTWYRHLCALSAKQKHKDILRKGLAFDVFKTCDMFQHYLYLMYEYAQKHYGENVTQYYEYLSCLRKECEVTGREWWFTKNN